jgi:WhiB family redox-sensing transcriptional regulator
VTAAILHSATSPWDTLDDDVARRRPTRRGCRAGEWPSIADVADVAVPRWMTHALCVTADPQTFKRAESATYQSRAVWKARAICAACPVRRECLESAMEHEEEYGRTIRIGVWGGMSPFEREQYWPEWNAEREIVRRVRRVGTPT